MRVLVVNCGSSSLKLDVIETTRGERLRVARAERVGDAECRAHLGEETLDLPGADHAAALEAILPRLTEGLAVEAVGHRVVHGGARFDRPIRIDASDYC